MVIAKPTIVETMTKEVFDEFYYKGEALFKKIHEKQKQILLLQSDIAALVTEYIDLVEIERKKRKHDERVKK
ncbi:hypothetical protein KA005_68055 [bacterium]|nr:hypothetical protein [bacterium]